MNLLGSGIQRFSSIGVERCPMGPPLLEQRRHLQKDSTEQMWKSLQHQGWRPTKPLWGAGTEP
ncbi:DUF1651 domain-containing protein [Parasynechococcus marenigrum]|uniref:Uncharacterized protein n=1 Tax=Parasynechococcus marenigrum (strain WH8102) TaxID=84588 RepID=Q7U4W9_PARMW|nr:conserved hypothetical protein [Parasynechococcus marenigrum WH 8102]